VIVLSGSILFLMPVLLAIPITSKVKKVNSKGEGANS